MVIIGSVEEYGVGKNVVDHSRIGIFFNSDSDMKFAVAWGDEPVEIAIETKDGSFLREVITKN